MNIFRNIGEHLRKALAPAICAVLAASAVAMALTVPATYPPRMFGTEQTHYLRFTVNFNDCVLASNTCSLKRGAVPYNAFIVRAYRQLITAFNSGTSDYIAITAAAAACTTTTGNCGATANVLVMPETGAGIHGTAGTGAISLTVFAGSAGTNATGAGDTPTGADGGFDIYAQYLQVSTAPTAGQAVYVLEYIAPNDGSCTTPALGAVPSPSAC